MNFSTFSKNKYAWVERTTRKAMLDAFTSPYTASISALSRGPHCVNTIHPEPEIHEQIYIYISMYRVFRWLGSFPTHD